MRSCRALIFDFDGVIVESEHIKSRAFAVLYGEYGDAAAAAAVAHHEANGGISRRKKIRYLHKTLLGIELAEETLETLCRRFSMLVEDEVVGCGWVPGAREVLAEQFGRRPLFVVSGTPQDELARIVERRGLARWFAEVLRIAAGEGDHHPRHPRPARSRPRHRAVRRRRRRRPARRARNRRALHRPCWPMPNPAPFRPARR